MSYLDHLEQAQAFIGWAVRTSYSWSSAWRVWAGSKDFDPNDEAAIRETVAKLGVVFLPEE